MMVQNSIGRCIDDAGVTRSVGCDTPGTVHATEKVTQQSQFRFSTADK